MRYIINERLFMRRPPEGPLAAHVRPFGEWAFEQGYSKYRVHRRVVLAAGFSQWLRRRGIRTGKVRGEHAAQYLRHRSGQKQIERGAITADLAAAVPKVAGWSMTGIPRAITAEEIRKLLSSIDRRHAKGRRDYAILLLLARLGMRSGEIARLDLDDIDWNSGSLKVRGKGREARLPLPQDVGKAIVDYLRHGRPLTTSRRLFLRTKAPYRGFRDSTVIAGIVRYAIERAGVRSPTHGAHQFRHALATRMLHRGGSLKEIGELLGHRSIEVTRIYAKVDIPALRTLALRWPGGAL